MSGSTTSAITMSGVYLLYVIEYPSAIRSMIDIGEYLSDEGEEVSPPPDVSEGEVTSDCEGVVTDGRAVVLSGDIGVVESSGGGVVLSEGAPVEIGSLRSIKVNSKKPSTYRTEAAQRHISITMLTHRIILPLALVI